MLFSIITAIVIIEQGVFSNRNVDIVDIMNRLHVPKQEIYVVGNVPKKSITEHSKVQLLAYDHHVYGIDDMINALESKYNMKLNSQSYPEMLNFISSFYSMFKYPIHLMPEIYPYLLQGDFVVISEKSCRFFFQSNVIYMNDQTLLEELQLYTNRLEITHFLKPVLVLDVDETFITKDSNNKGNYISRPFIRDFITTIEEHYDVYLVSLSSDDSIQDKLSKTGLLDLFPTNKRIGITSLRQYYNDYTAFASNKITRYKHKYLYAIPQISDRVLLNNFVVIDDLEIVYPRYMRNKILLVSDMSIVDVVKDATFNDITVEQLDDLLAIK